MAPYDADGRVGRVDRVYRADPGRRGPIPPFVCHRRVAGSDLPVRDGLAVAKSSIIGHLFAGEKGVRSSVRRDNSLRGTGGCG